MKLTSRLFLSINLLGCFSLASSDYHFNSEDPKKVIEVKAKSREDRTKLANLGYSLEDIRSDKIFIYGQESDVQRLQNLGHEVRSWDLKPEWLNLETASSAQDMGHQATNKFTSLDEVQKRLETLAASNPTLVSLESLGRSVEGRDQKILRISGKSRGEAESQKLPVAFYMGCHHAREHLSVEVPLMFAEYLVDQYGKNTAVTNLIDSREIYIAPVVNPDGHAYDFSNGIRGKMWRKNRRRNNDGSYGVDLNRNYGFMWGTGGSSKNPTSDVYMGTSPFSEPETNNVREFIKSQPRMTILLSFHTFSELILYPWGHTYDKVGEGKGKTEDRAVFEKMARQMAGWNHYTPQQSSELYIASGDTTDWAYGERGIIAFTFELSPSSMAGGGFYPNPSTTIQPTFDANINPMLYLLEYADNPKRVLQGGPAPSFVQTPVKAGLPIADFRDLH